MDLLEQRNHKEFEAEKAANASSVWRSRSNSEKQILALIPMKESTLKGNDAVGLVINGKSWICPN